MAQIEDQVEDPIKDLSVAGKVTSGIDHMHPYPMSIYRESQSVFQCLFLDPIFYRYNIVDFVRCLVKTVELSMLAKRCTLFRRVVFCLVFRPLIQITATYERLGLTTAVNPFHGLRRKSPGRANRFPAFHQDVFGLITLVHNMFIPSQFTIQGDTQELGRRLHLYHIIVNFQKLGKF